jgi:hypothetical protein
METFKEKEFLPSKDRRALCELPVMHLPWMQMLLA